MSGLVENFIRRIEKLLNVRATIPVPGTNHVDGTWLNTDIYPGELGVKLDTGNLYTSDGVGVIDLSRENVILYGLNLQKDTTGQNKLTVTSGSARINGATYDFTSSGTDFGIAPNIGTDPILYFVYGNATPSVSPIPGNYVLGLNVTSVSGSLNESGIFTDITSTENYPVPQDDSLLLGAVILYPGSAGQDLWPLSVTTLGDYYPKFSTTPSEFLRTVSKQVTQYKYTTLYVPGQFVTDHASNTTYLSKRLFVSSSTSISTDISNGNLVLTAGGGSGGGSYTAISVGTGAEVYKTTVLTQFQFRSLKGTYPVILTQNANDITIGLSMSAFVGSLANIGAGATVYSSITSGGIAQLRSLTAGSSRLTISTIGNNIVLDVPQIGTTAQGRNLGNTLDVDIYAGMTGVNLGFRRLRMGAGMTATQYSEYIDLSTTVRNNSGVNLPGGAPLYYGMAGDNLSFRSLTAGSNITITNLGNQIQISSSGGGGSVTGATNLGSYPGGELYTGPVGSNLGFRNISPGYGIAITRVGNDVQIDTTVSNGAQGFQGSQGPQGFQGLQGFQGVQGFQGASGTNGTNGLQGRQGPYGPQGNDGPLGPTGIPGLNAPVLNQRIIELYDNVGGATVSAASFRILNLDAIRLNTDPLLYQIGAVSQIAPNGTYVQIAESGNYKFDFNVTLQVPTNAFVTGYIWNNSTNTKVVGSDIWFNTRSGTETVTSSASITLSVSGGSQYSIRLESISGAATTQQFASNLTIYRLEIGMGYQGPQGASGANPTTVNNITSTVLVGAINPGDVISSGSTLESFINQLVHKVYYPTYTIPTYALTTSALGLQEIGATISVPLTFTYNRGTINGSGIGAGWSASVSQNPRGGTSGTYTLGPFGGVQVTQPGNSYTVTNYNIAQGIQVFEGLVTYSTGPQPIDSDGMPYQVGFTAGTSPTKTVLIEGVYPLFATISSITTLSQISPLYSMISANNIQINLFAESGLNKQAFDLPLTWVTSRPLVSVLYYNLLSGNFDPLNKIGDFTVTSVVHTIQGSSVNYNRYTYNGPQRASQLIKLTF